jgi:chitin synthase
VTSPYASKDEMVINAAPTAVEEVPSSCLRRWWLVLVWGFTGGIPSFVLRYVSRMKRPDIRLAWREKFTIFVLIFLMNALVIFYIVEFGRLLCLNFDKARMTTELAEHTGDSD